MCAPNKDNEARINVRNILKKETILRKTNTFLGIYFLEFLRSITLVTFKLPKAKNAAIVFNPLHETAVRIF